MILIPEVVLKKILDYILKNIDENYLEKLFGELHLGDYDYSENAKKLFDRRGDNTRKVESNLFFNRNRAALPTVHITLPSEVVGGDLGLGFDPGEETEQCSGNISKTSTRAYSSKYLLVFTSNNTFEVLIMYNVIRAFLQGNVFLLEENGLRNPKFSGNDIVLSQDIIPADIYARAFGIEFIYSVTAPEFKIQASDGSINSIIFDGTSII